MDASQARKELDSILAKFKAPEPDTEPDTSGALEKELFDFGIRCTDQACQFEACWKSAVSFAVIGDMKSLRRALEMCLPLKPDQASLYVNVLKTVKSLSDLYHTESR